MISVVVDCRDSYVYNLSSLLEDLGSEVLVVPEDSPEASDPLSLEPDALVVSPGPGKPEPGRGSWKAVSACLGKIPILGVCLGHQTLCAVSGARIIHGEGPMHGKIVRIEHDGEGLMEGIPQGFPAVRYNSLVVDRDSVPDCIRVDAVDGTGDIMAVSRIDVPAFGTQFHPESFMTEHGADIVANFLRKVHDREGPREVRPGLVPVCPPGEERNGIPRFIDAGGARQTLVHMHGSVPHLRSGRGGCGVGHRFKARRRGHGRVRLV